MNDWVVWLVGLPYLLATVGLLIYGLNCYVMLALFARRRRAAFGATAAMRKRWADDPSAAARLPVVTTQIAVYNEMNVAERIMRAACAMVYPRGKHEVQVLDDSTDETRLLVERVARDLRAQGHDIRVLHRGDRRGFKAGALADGLRVARGELLAIFDADFVPPPEFLQRMAPFFVDDGRLGFLQARWGHLNPDGSLLSKAQSIGIDGHFIVEQVARAWNGLFMNFNGTAGVWRKAAIEAGGGWQSDTLTEDLDLSYRVQFAGWHGSYLPDLLVPGELPEDVTAFRSQQFRWAKGSFQTVRKLTGRLFAMPVPLFKKLQGLLHMSGYAVHPMMLTLSLLSLPILHVVAEFRAPQWATALLAVPLGFSVVAPSLMYAISQAAAGERLRRLIPMLPALVVVGVGLALSNTRAIVEALLGRESEFVRTPKRGDRAVKAYRLPFPWVAAMEIVLGLYNLVALRNYLEAGKTSVCVFLGIYAAGFLFVGLLSLVHAAMRSRRSADPLVPQNAAASASVA
jgi:cellulose synthase/poly-beta-1,6-N-acetylglucosamine synthase-like glycosyltransferase